MYVMAEEVTALGGSNMRPLTRLRNELFTTKSLAIVTLVMFFVLLIKLNSIGTEVSNQSLIEKAMEAHRDSLQLSSQQLELLRLLETKQLSRKLPIIYCITPTYWRPAQKAELTRISQTLMLVPKVHWIVIEDSEEKTQLVSNLISHSHLTVTHLNAKTPPFEQLKDRTPRWTKHRGVEQRNAALQWLRENLKPDRDEGVVYFMDDDNTYSIRLFDEIRKVKKVGVWPVGLVGGLNAEKPIVDENGKVKSFQSGWRADRPFAIDMAGFAINLRLILEHPLGVFSYKMEKGLQESQFLSYFTTKEELEPLADNCTQVYVWHTRTEKTKINGKIPGLEV